MTIAGRKSVLKHFLFERLIDPDEDGISKLQGRTSSDVKQTKGSGVRDKRWRHIADPRSSQHFNYDRVVALLSGDHVDEGFAM
ncbi:hypothetical protein LSAT2_021178 [Lamellibrachia satsuma]|nr:hypothetical protein LSAT2_021178 [Lamellibrachia satsuma]